MNTNFFTFVMITGVVIVVMSFARKTRNKLAKSEDKDKVQKPGIFDRLISRIMVAVASLSTLMMVLGTVIGENKMATVFLVVTFAFWGMNARLKRECNLSYQEHAEFFLLKSKGIEYKVYYKNIADWLPEFNEIALLDKTRKDGRYIKVNIATLHPQILLQKIVEMTFEGEFQHVNKRDRVEDPKRENELIDFLESYNYGYLVKDYVKE